MKRYELTEEEVQIISERLNIDPTEIINVEDPEIDSPICVNIFESKEAWLDFFLEVNDYENLINYISDMGNITSDDVGSSVFDIILEKHCPLYFYREDGSVVQVYYN